MVCVRAGVLVWGVGVVCCCLLVLMPPTPTHALASPQPHLFGGGRFIAGSLGFAAGVAVGRHRGRYHGSYHGRHYGGCSNYGKCYGYHGRKRRSINQLYKKISEVDKDQCGKRLLCELAQKDPKYLTPKQTLILLPYRGRDATDEGTYFGQYDKAVWYGEKGKSCHDVYSSCPYPAHIIMQ